MPLLGCHATAQDYVAYWGRSEEDPTLDGFLIEIDSGARSWGDCEVIGDGYHPNPWSDLVAAGAYPPDIIIDVTTQEVLLKIDGVGDSGIISKWILPDAGLARMDDMQLLRYSDGREVYNPSVEIILYKMLSDGSCIFGLDSSESSVLHGNIDWETFEKSDVDTLDSPDEYLLPWSPIAETPDQSGLVFESSNSLYLIDIPL